jgi:Rps23 Pro-64 3,4-dihydroxylase Tpa1-like proline 4-hydroxylase
MIFDEFLVAQELRGLLTYALRNASGFAASSVIRYDGVKEHDVGNRRSRVLFDLGPFHSLFQHRLLTFLPRVLQGLPIAPFPVSSLEIQLTATNDGEFFRAHTDIVDGEIHARQLTFVFFFHGEPRKFGGGELRIFDKSDHDEPAPASTDEYQLVYPSQNQIVFFPSWYLHEILPVKCPSGEFADSRFTLNGWYRR